MTTKITNEKEALEQLPRMLEDLYNHPENFNRLLNAVETPLTVIDGGKTNVKN